MNNDSKFVACNLRNFAFVLVAVFISFSFSTTYAQANNACRSPAISTFANVTTSAGSTYQVKTSYRTPKEMVTTFVSDGERIMAIEGPASWMRVGNDEEMANDQTKRFIVGHQYHALLLHFDELIAEITDVDAVELNGQSYSGRIGDFPYGGRIALAQHDDGRAAGLKLNLPDESEIIVSFSDWREATTGEQLPYALEISHDGVTYDYRYAELNFSEYDAIDFHGMFPAPDSDAVQIHRLHRALMTAHCRGDAQMMGALTAPEAIVANRGSVDRVTDKQTAERFSSVFSRVNYTGYHDLKDPVVAASASGDLGWIVVNVRAEGTITDTGDAFSDVWAWAMLVRKIDGEWLNAGNASNVMPQPEAD